MILKSISLGVILDRLAGFEKKSQASANVIGKEVS
jgi:hypothetical protein